MGVLIIPGTTIALTLMPTYVEVRDKGVIKKKIPLKGKSFDDVSLELQKYLRYLGKRLAPGVLDDVLGKIGLPKARRVIAEPEPEPVSIQEPEPEPEPILEKPPEKFERAPKKEPEPAAQFVSSPGVSADERGTISADDFDDIADALKAVESMSDSFMAGAPESGGKKQEKPAKISIEVEGSDVVAASSNTYARAADLKEPEPAIEEEPVLIAETIEEEGLEEPPAKAAPEKTAAPEHQIKPIVSAKALLLGEQGVGKRSLISKAGIMPIVVSQESGEVSKYIFGKLFDAKNHRINLNVWSFDLAVKSKVSRKEFYENAHVIIIVYAASDRWSFESLDFWLREAGMTDEKLPPLVFVGNKTDLRGEPLLGDESGEEPVSYDEGFRFAEDLAKKLGEGDQLHPIAFIESSCLTGDKTEDVFKTAAELFENTI